MFARGFRGAHSCLRVSVTCFSRNRAGRASRGLPVGVHEGGNHRTHFRAPVEGSRQEDLIDGISQQQGDPETNPPSHPGFLPPAEVGRRQGGGRASRRGLQESSAVAATPRRPARPLSSGQGKLLESICSPRCSQGPKADSSGSLLSEWPVWAGSASTRGRYGMAVRRGPSANQL